MCGLALILRKDGLPAIKQLIKTYEKQKSRGQQGFGYVAFSHGKIEDVSRSATEKDIYVSLKSLGSEAVMFHHRFPTSTPNFKEGAHPIYVSNKRLKYDYYVVHNGVISNDVFLKSKHEGLGYVYTTEMVKREVWSTRDESYVEEKEVIKFNDSESLAIELAEAIESGADKVEAYGSIAFICIQATKYSDKKDINIEKIFFGRNTSPLKIENNNNFLKLSSEGNGEDVSAHTLFVYSPSTNLIMEKKCTFGSDWSKYTGRKWITAFTDKNGVYHEGHFEGDDDDDDDVSYYCGFNDKDLDERRAENRRKAIEAKKEIDKELDQELRDMRMSDDEAWYEEQIEKYNQNLDDGLDQLLTGEETLEELKEMYRKFKLKYQSLVSKGNIAESDEVWYMMTEIEEAIHDWEINNSEGEQPKLLG